MSNYFFPSGIDLDDTATPAEILATAQEAWQSSSHGILTLVFQAATTQSGGGLIVVHAKHVSSNRTASLFSVIHRPGEPYPVAIVPKEDDLPDYLRKSYFQEEFNPMAAFSSALPVRPARQVRNEWVAETPAEFRSKLSEAFNLGFVKAVVLNLTASKPTWGKDEIAPTHNRCDPDGSLADSEAQ